MKNLLLLSLLLVTHSIVSQNNITGTIKDTEGNPVIFANIYLPQLEKGTFTDDSGTFELKSLPTGTYKIVVSLLGFDTYSDDIRIPLNSPLLVVLESSAIEMDEVVISTPFHKLQRDNVMKVEQQSLAEIKAQGAMTLGEGIANISGVNTISTGVGISKPVIRGLSSNRVLVYTQGIRMENQQFGDEHGLGINEAGISSVEVIKGPASLLYGSDALGGVLYLNPERFASEDSLDVSISSKYFGNTQGFANSLGAKTSSENFKFLIRGSLTNHSDYKTPEYRVTNSRFNEKDVKAGFGYQKGKFRSELRYNYNFAELGMPEEIGEQTTEKHPEMPFQEVASHILSNKSQFYFGDSNLEVTWGYIQNNRKEFEEHHEEEGEEHEGEEEEHGHEGAALNMRLRTFSYDAKYHLPELGKFETIFGIQGMFQSNANFGEETLIPDANTTDFGVLGTSHIHFETVDLQIGLRYDHRNIDIENDFSRDFNSFNAAAGLKTNIFKNVVTRLNFASGFRAPNLAELTSEGSHEGTNRYEIGNPDLTNERNFQIDLALEYGNDHFEIFANGFTNFVNDYIYLTPTGNFVDADPEYLYVQENAKLYGGELGIHIHPHPLDWLHYEASFESVTGKQDNGDYLPLIPANSLNNMFRVEFPKGFVSGGQAFVKLSSIFSQNNVHPEETSTPGYSLWSTGLSGTIMLFNKPLGLNFTVTNLGDKKYINHLSRLKPDGIFNIGRNISFGLNYEI